MNNQIQKYPSGEGKILPTLSEFRALCEGEFKIQYNALVDEYRGRNQNLVNLRERKIAEYEFINSLIALNSLRLEQKLDPILAAKIEGQIAGLNYETIAASYPLRFWRTQYGEGMITQVVCDLMDYFLSQFQIKEMLADVQKAQLAIKLLSSQPELRILELVFVLNSAVQGQYGPTYQRIGIDTVLGWLKQFYNDSSIYLENKRINAKPESARGETPWIEIEKRLQRYETEQREKHRITEKVYGFEKRKQEVEEYKAGLKSG